MKNLSYRELRQLNTFKERYEYLRLDGVVGKETFGFDRYLNQVFYHSPEWKKLRNQIILRDNGCDLGIPGHEIVGKVYIHHMNPITYDDLVNRSDNVMNPDYLICVSHNTHNAIHYGDESLVRNEPIVRTMNDTCPWKKM